MHLHVVVEYIIIFVLLIIIEQRKKVSVLKFPRKIIILTKSNRINKEKKDFGQKLYECFLKKTLMST